MHRILLIGVLSTVAAVSIGHDRFLTAPPSQVSPAAAAAIAGLPIQFEANRGQAGDRVRFLARGPGYSLLLGPADATFAFAARPASPRTAAFPYERADATPGGVVRMRFARANPAPEIAGRDPLKSTVNYIRGNDPSRWQHAIPTFARVEYRGVYPGVDLVYHGDNGELEYDFVVAPGAEPRVIGMMFDGVDDLRHEPSGNLRLRTAAGELSLEPPYAYQDVGGTRRTVASRYVVGPGEVGIEVGDYDTSVPLVIDPVLVYSTFLGGSEFDSVHDIAVDADGFIYVAGTTGSPDFPTLNAGQPANGGRNDLFVVKLAPGGSSIVYSTYIGGSDDEQGWGVAADCEGNAYVSGDSLSSDFPVLNAFQPVRAGSVDAVVTKLDAAGTLVYSTYLGGNAIDGRAKVSAGCDGSIYVSGQTQSGDFPVVNALQPVHRGGFDAFAAKLTVDGSALVYSTYLGGSFNDALLAFAVDIAGRAHLAGTTASSNFPTAAAVQPSNAGFDDAFVSALSADGSALVFSTYLGGSSGDGVWGMDVDETGSVFLAGRTRSPDFPTVNAAQPVFGDGFFDGLVAKLGPGGSPLVYSTFLGGSDIDWGMDVAAGPNAQAYVTGFTESADFPLVRPMQATFNGFEYALVTKVAADGAFVYSTYLGGGFDEGWGIDVDALGTAYVAGTTGSDGFPVRKPLQAELRGNNDAFIARINDEIFCLKQLANVIGTPGGDVLVGTAFADVVAALGGNDIVLGLGGNDLICGGSGNDFLAGGSGFDFCFGGPGTDASACESSAGIP